MNGLSTCRFLQLSLDERSIFILAWELSFARNLSVEDYNWIFNENNLIYVAMIGSDIAAGLCLYPMLAVINATDSNALLANNGFVSPKYRGKNLFVRLSQFALSDANNQGYKIAYGVSNEQILPSHKKVGWTPMFHLQFLDKQCLKHNKHNGVQWFNEKLTDLQRMDIETCSRKSSLHRGFSIIKTMSFIRWRYENKPNIKYLFALKYQGKQLLAYAVCKYYSENKCLHFIDLDGENENAINQLIESADSLDIPFERLNIWSSSAHFKTFISRGYKYEAEERSFILIHPDRRDEIKINGDINLVFGDNDVY